MNSELSRGQSHELLTRFEELGLRNRQAQAAADNRTVRWQIMVRWRQLVPTYEEEEDECVARADLPDGRFIGRREAYEQFGFECDSPAVRKGDARMLARFLKRFSLWQGLAVIWVPCTSLVKIRNRLPEEFFSTCFTWNTGNPDAFAEDVIRGGYVLFDLRPSAEGHAFSEDMSLQHMATPPHPCEAIYVLAMLSLLKHGQAGIWRDRCVRCKANDALVATCFHGLKARHMWYRGFRVEGTNTKQDLYDMNCVRIS